MTAYRKIDGPDEENRLDHMAQGIIGTAMDRPEGALKVTGRAPYADERHPEGTAYGFLLRSAITRGSFSGLNEDALLAMPGVLAVITDVRLLRNSAQGGANEAPVQDPHRIAYAGQPIGVVVAETFEQARHAAQAARFDYLPDEGAVVDPQAPGLEQELPEGKQSSQGDLDAAMAQAAHSVDCTYSTPSMSSAPMEPHASVAEWEGEMLTLRGSYQMLKYNRNELADSLGIEPENVRILSPYVGGGFGSKLGISPEAVAAALAARQLDRPVAVAMHRRQVFETTTRRSETRQRIRLAADADGRLTGIGHDSLVSNLPEEEFSEPVAQATPFTYAAAHRQVVHRIARIHRPAAGSVRAPGEAVGVCIFENALDELAEEIGLDPVELRLRNIPETDPKNGKPFSSHKLAEALRRGAEDFGWQHRAPSPRARREGEWYIGMGMASAVRVNILSESQARVLLNADGTVLVETDMTDIGTGTYAVLTQIAAEMLGLPPGAVTVRLGDTNLPPAAGSGGSWGASSSGTSVYLACEELRRSIAERLGCPEADMTLKDGQVIHANESRALTEVLDGEPLEALGHLEPGAASKKTRQATFGAHFAEVAVSAVTGETRVRRMLGVFAAGRILNRKTAESQCYGGMTFGIGMALTEELIHDPRDGHIVNRDLAEYHLPVNLDVPQLKVHLLEERDPWANPMQSKGIGELGICGAAGAVTNAIYNACGVRVRDYPATLDKVLAGLD